MTHVIIPHCCTVIATSPPFQQTLHLRGAIKNEKLSGCESLTGAHVAAAVAHASAPGAWAASGGHH